MNELVEVINEQVVTTSKQVAEVFDKQHKDVMKAIRNLLGDNNSAQNCAQWFTVGKYKDASGKENNMYIMNRDGFSLLAMGFTGSKAIEFKVKYIEAFNRMEEELKNSAMTKFSKLPLSEQMLMVMNAQQEDIQKVSKQVTDVDHRVHDLEENVKVDGADMNEIAQAVKIRVKEQMQLYGWNDAKDYQKLRSRLYSDLNGSVKIFFNVSSRAQLKQKQMSEVMAFIRDWNPNSVTIAKNRKQVNQTTLEV